jgi:hypothetical protein
MKPKAYAAVTGTIFLAVAAAHVWRLFGGYEFRVGPWDVPTWGSMIAVAVAGYLSFAGLRIATRP